MLVFLKAADFDAGLQAVLNVVMNERVMDNDLSTATVVAVRGPGGQANVQNSDSYDGFRVVYPPQFECDFAPWAE